MSEKDFDNQIRKKLDSLQSDYTPEAWENFKKLLPVPWYISFLRNYGGWVFGGVSSLALLFNLLINPKSQTFEKTDTITKIETPDFKTDTVYERDTVSRIDTVIKYIYLTKYINREVSQQLVEQMVTQRVTKRLEDMKRQEDLAQVLQMETALSQNKGEEITEKEKGEHEELVSKKSVKEILKDTTSIQLAEKPTVPKNNFWTRLNIRPGVEVDYMGNKAFSFGPLAEVFIKNRFSVSTGVAISNSSPSTFPITKEFNKHTGKDFDKQYKPSKPTGPYAGGIKDITVETSRIRMPIYMSYYVPLSYKLDFLISTGTRLDLKVSENVSYTNEGFYDAPYQSVETNYKPKVFNNLYYGMGFQYRYGRVYGQLTPYFEFPFSKPSYVITNNKFGISGSLRFSLK